MWRCVCCASIIKLLFSTMMSTAWMFSGSRYPSAPITTSNYLKKPKSIWIFAKLANQHTINLWHPIAYIVCYTFYNYVSGAQTQTPISDYPFFMRYFLLNRTDQFGALFCSSAAICVYSHTFCAQNCSVTIIHSVLYAHNVYRIHRNSLPSIQNVAGFLVALDKLISNR